MNYVFNDGGRKDAGYQGHTGDCVTRAIAIATETPYQKIYDDLNAMSLFEKRCRQKKSNSRTGVRRTTLKKYLLDKGWKWTPTMFIGSGCKVHLREEELPTGRLIVNVSKHIVAVLDGVINDTYDPSRHGERCVYGYYSKT